MAEGVDVEIYLSLPNAVMPEKKQPGDVGLDLTAVAVAKTFEDDPLLVIYDTGVCIQVMTPGWTVDIVPRSSFSKSRCFVPNTPGIIDAEYTGSLKVAVRKQDASVPDLVLPYTGWQIVLRPTPKVNITERFVPFGKTKRGDGGYGSTGGNPVFVDEDKPASQEARQLAERLLGESYDEIRARVKREMDAMDETSAAKSPRIE